MIDFRKLRELVRLMVENDLSELELKDQQETVSLKRHGEMVHMAPPPDGAHVVGSAGREASDGGAAAAGEGEPPSESGAVDNGLTPIESPMVGTFYAAPNPDTDPYVKVGDSVTPDTVVCIVEAMKVFNEIKAGCSGTVERILTSNGESVEFGQQLFLVRTS